MKKFCLIFNSTEPIVNEAVCAEVQRRLFDLGYKWTGNQGQNVYFADRIFRLIIGEDKFGLKYGSRPYANEGETFYADYDQFTISDGVSCFLARARAYADSLKAVTYFPVDGVKVTINEGKITINPSELLDRLEKEAEKIRDDRAKGF